MAKWRPSEETWRAANEAVAKSGALDKAAQRLVARATQISRENGGSANYRAQPKTRPGGRAVVDVISDNIEEERGSESVKRINALRRAARGE